MPTASYPVDLSGVAPSNYIQNELHTVNEANFRDYYFIVPLFAPFYIDNFSITLKVNNVQRTLQEDIDFSFALPYIAGTRSTGKAMYGAITLNNIEMNGILSINYQTVGGDIVCDQVYVLSYLVSKAYNPRIIAWDNISNKPDYFPVTPHYQDFDQYYGQEELVNALGQIRDAIANKTANILSQLDLIYSQLSPSWFKNYVPISGGRMTGPLELADDPLRPLEPVTKRYFDNFAYTADNIGVLLSNYIDHETFERNNEIVEKNIDDLKSYVLTVTPKMNMKYYIDEIKLLREYVDQKVDEIMGVINGWRLI